MTNYNNEHLYDDIINLPHHVSKKHPPMPISDMAAQFSPFAALTGHDEAIAETARLTDSKAELTEDRITELNMKIQILLDHADERPAVSIEYYVADKKKAGGAYFMATGNFRRIDESRGEMVFTDGSTYPLEDIFSMTSELFDMIIGFSSGERDNFQ